MNPVWRSRLHKNNNLTGSAWTVRCGGITIIALLILSSQNGYAQLAEINVLPESDSVEVSILSDTNAFYGLEQSSDLFSWEKKDTFSGDGSRKVLTVPTSSNMGFFRFVREENGTLYAPTNYSFSANVTFSEQGEQSIQLLDAGGIEDYNALLNRFRSVYRLNDEIERLQAQGLQVEARDIIHLLREGELRANLQAAVDAGSLEHQVVDDLVKARFSLSDLHNLLRSLSPEIQAVPPQATSMAAGPVANSEPGAMDRRSLESRMVLNNSLREVGGQTLTRAQFGLLQEFVRTLTPQDLKILQDTNQDRADGRGSLELLPAQSELAAISPIPEDRSYIPQVAKQQNFARVKIEPIPLTIIGTQPVETGSIVVTGAVEAMPPFTTDLEGTDFRTFLVNKTGLAWFRVYGPLSGGALNIRTANDSPFCTATIPSLASRAILLPIGQDQVCEEFRIQKSGSADFQLIAINSVESLDSHVGENGLHAVGVEVPTQRGGIAGGAGWYSFHVIIPGDAPVAQTLHLQLNDESAEPVARKVVALSPSGAVVEQALVPGADITLELSLVSGLWQLMVLPDDAFSLQHGEAFPSSVNPCVAQGILENAEVSLDLKLSFAPVKTRQFVIGTLESASFCRDGESAGNRAEVKLSLTANIAPRFENSTSFFSVFEDPQAFEAWDLWVKNGRSTDGLGSNPSFLAGLDAIKQNSWVSQRLLAITEFPSNEMWLEFYTAYLHNELGGDWYAHLDSAQELYESWLGQVVQINAMKFPMGNRYNLIDSAGSMPMHPVMPVLMPQFAFPKDRMAEESLPICSTYSAVEMDELNKSALFGSILKGVVNAGLSIASGNFADAACSGVTLLDEMNSTIEAAKDDPIGAANYRMNRASSLHGFYGLDDATRNPIVYSGYAKDNQNYAMANALSWAKLACSASSLLGSISSGGAGGLLDSVYVAQGLLALHQGDVTDVDNLKDLFLELAADSPELIAAVNQFFDQLDDGVLEDDFAEKLDFSELSDALDEEESDMWFEFIDLLNAVQEMRGVGQLGFNEIHSSAKFPFAPYDIRKTQGRSEVSVVRSVPLRQLTVALDRVQAFDLQENFDYDPYAELFMNTRVGVVSDQSPSSWSDVDLQYVDEGVVIADNGAKGFATVGGTPFSAYARRVFSERSMLESDAGENMFPFGPDDLANPMLMNCQWSGAGNNAAAIFVEVGVYEDDGGTADDDMVGVFSETFLLEDLMKEGQSSWTRMSDDVWRLSITNAPVFSSKWLKTEIEIGTSAAASQREHNEARLEHPSALISLHIDMTLGEFSDWVDENDYDIRRTVSEALPSELNPRVIASSDSANIEQILAYSAPWALTRQMLASGATQNRLDVWTVSTNPAAITHQATLPGSDGDFTPFENSNYLHAALANDGRYVVVLSTDGLSVYDVQAPDFARSDFHPMADLYPSRLAVDALGDLIYVSLREYDSDLRVFTINAQGELVAQGAYDDINRTIVGLIPMPEGGLIIHYAAHTETDCHDYGEGFWDNYEDVFTWVGTYPHANGFWHMRRDGNALELASAIELAGDLSKALMTHVGKRNQSSAFRLYDQRTIISREHASEVAVGLDMSGNFLPMENLNHVLYDGGWVSKLAGVNMGGHQVSARIPSRNSDYTRRYHDCAAYLSPACVFNDLDYVPLNTDVPLSMNSDIYPLGDPQNRFALTSVAEWPDKPRSDKQQLNTAAKVWTRQGHITTGQDLALIDLYATHQAAILNPELKGISGFYLGGAPELLTWIDNEQVLGSLDRGTIASPHAFVMDASDSANLTLSAMFCRGYNTHAVAAGAADGSSFVASQYQTTNFIYRFTGDAASPTEEQTIETSWRDIEDLLLLSDSRLLSADGSSILKCYAPDPTNGGWHQQTTFDLGIAAYVYDLVLSEDGTKLAVFHAVDPFGAGGHRFTLFDATALASDQVVALGGWQSDVIRIGTTDLFGVFSNDGDTLYVANNFYNSTSSSSYYEKYQIERLDVSDPTDISLTGLWLRNTRAEDICLTPDETALMVAGQGALEFFDTVLNPIFPIGSLIPNQSIPLVGANQLALSPDGQRVAVGCGTENHLAVVELYNDGRSVPYEATALNPSHWAVVYAAQTPLLSWRFGTGQYLADQYHPTDWCSVYLSTDYERVEDLDPSAKVLSDFTTLSTNYVAVEPLEFEQTYYWRVVGHNSFGSSTSTVYRFSTAAAPLPPYAPSAHTENGRTGVKVDASPALQWGFWTDDEHPLDRSDLYLSSDSNLVNSLDLSVWVASEPSVDGTYTPPENFAMGQTYYWCVVGHNISGSTTGEVWSFSTESILSLPVEQGFENGLPEGWHNLESRYGDTNGLAGVDLNEGWSWNTVWDTNQIHSGTGALGMNGGSMTFHWLESPMFVAQPNTVLSSWIYYGPDEWGNQPAPLHLLVKSGGTWSTLRTWTAAETNLYQSQVTIPLVDYAGQTIRIAWVYDMTYNLSGNNSAVALDDLLIQNDP